MYLLRRVQLSVSVRVLLLRVQQGGSVVVLLLTSSRLKFSGGAPLSPVTFTVEIFPQNRPKWPLLREYLDSERATRLSISHSQFSGLAQCATEGAVPSMLRWPPAEWCLRQSGECPKKVRSRDCSARVGVDQSTLQERAGCLKHGAEAGKQRAEWRKLLQGWVLVRGQVLRID